MTDWADERAREWLEAETKPSRFLSASPPEVRLAALLREVGPSAARLAEKYVERAYQRLERAKYNLAMARQMQMAPQLIKYNKPGLEFWKDLFWN